MEFLKALFENGAALTFEQLEAKVKEAKFNVVNIADGSYVSKGKYDDKTNALGQQVTDLQGQLSQRDKDIKDLQTKLTAAQGDQTKLADVQAQLTTLQGKYDTDKQDWEKKTQQQTYSFMVKEKANGLKFTSPAAKRDFIRQVEEKNFKIEGENLTGYEEFVTKYKTENPGALEEESKPDGNNNGGNQKPVVVVPPKAQPNNNGGGNQFGFSFNGVRQMPKDK